jgi:hypothetical protein
MKCYLHIEQEIVAQCQSCSRGLCPECSEMFQSPTCQNCASAQNRQYRGMLLRQLLISGGIFFLIFTSMAGDAKAHHPLVFSFLVAYAAASVPWGWSILNRITPDVFLVLPLIGWLFYFGFKFYISGMLGFFIAPFKIYKAIQELRELNKQRVESAGAESVSLKLVE